MIGDNYLLFSPVFELKAQIQGDFLITAIFWNFLLSKIVIFTLQKVLKYF
jgi:hypothetical protein